MSEVKAHLSEIADEVDRTQERVHLTRNGREYVVLLAAEDLESLEATLELLSVRRFLSRAAVGDPTIFRRTSSPQRGAAAVAWVTCRANGTVGEYWSGMSVQDLLSHFGVTGSVSQRAEPLLRANGVDPHARYGSMALGAPDLLTSKARAEIRMQRDRYVSQLEA